MRHFLAGLGLASALLIGPPASADPPSPASPTDTAAAEVLFQQAQKLFADGDYAAACPKFATSYQLDPGLGTLLNLARCYEKANKVASAWVVYVDLASLAARAGQADRHAIATERMVALEPELMRLSLKVPIGEPVEVTLDGELVNPELFGSALPLDPGEHVVTARRPGGEPYWSQAVRLTEPGQTVELVVEAPPPQAAEPPAPEPVPPPAPVTPPPAPTPVTPSVTEEGGVDAWIVTGSVLGGVALVAFGVSAGFTADASSAWGEAGCRDGLCPDADAQALSERAGRSADVATGLAVGGGLVAAVGAVFFVVGLTSGEPDHADVGFGPQGMRVRF